MRSLKLLAISTLIAIIIVSCGSGNSNNKAEMVNTSDTLLTLPKVPQTIADIDKKAIYLVENYWQNYNFADSTKANYKGYTEIPLFQYLSLFKELEELNLTPNFDQLVSQLMSASPKIREKFYTLFEYYLYHPNSTIRNDSLYIRALRVAIVSNSFSQLEKERFKFQIRMINLNKVGEKANNFSFIDRDSKTLSLNNINAKYLVLVLFDPECSHCQIVIEEMKKNHLFYNKKIKVVAVISDYNEQLFAGGLKMIPKEWIYGADKVGEISSNLLYDLRASPSLYLLDSEKRVILKDALYEDIADYLTSSI